MKKLKPQTLNLFKGLQDNNLFGKTSNLKLNLKYLIKQELKIRSRVLIIKYFISQKEFGIPF